MVQPVGTAPVHSVGTKSWRFSLIARAWQPCRTMRLGPVSWKANSRSRSAVSRRPGMPSAPTVSHTPRKLIVTSAWTWVRASVWNRSGACGGGER